MGGVQAFPRVGQTQWWMILRARAYRTEHGADRRRHLRSLGVAGTAPGRPRVTFSLRRMYSSSPRAKQTTMSSFLASEWTADNGKRSKTDAENEDQMSGKGSIASPGRIDTSDPRRPARIHKQRW